MMLLVRHPPSYPQEREYIFRVLLGDFLGVDWQARAEDRQDVAIELTGSKDPKQLRISDALFGHSPSSWLTTGTLPELPLRHWSAAAIFQSSTVDRPLPVIYGTPTSIVAEDALTLGLDIFGSAFFMLSRYEEHVRSERDEFGRFPAHATLAYRAGFIDRAIVNEYAELLLQCLQYLWPGIRGRLHQYRTVVTCDVDRPLTEWARRLSSALIKSGTDLLRRRSFRQAASSVRLYLDHRGGRYDRDPFFTFSWMHHACEAAGLRASYYFLSANTSPQYDGRYSLREPFARQLVRTLHQQGHEIGLHGSYNSFNSAEQLRREKSELEAVMSEEHVTQEVIGGRQHYLRWSAAETPRHLEAAGLRHDSTLGFNEVPGFRCGTCFEYPLYDLLGHRMLSVIERPMIAMEQSVLDFPTSRNIDPNTLQPLLSLKKTCRKHGGHFNFLWHNSRLTTPTEREFYLMLLKN